MRGRAARAAAEYLRSKSVKNVLKVKKRTFMSLRKCWYLGTKEAPTDFFSLGGTTDVDLRIWVEAPTAANKKFARPLAPNIFWTSDIRLDNWARRWGPLSGEGRGGAAAAMADSAPIEVGQVLASLPAGALAQTCVQARHALVNPRPTGPR
jgi:hypothetical protein